MILGELVEEMHQVYGDWLSQVVRIYIEENVAEFEWVVGPIPIGRPTFYYNNILILNLIKK